MVQQAMVSLTRLQTTFITRRPPCRRQSRRVTTCLCPRRPHCRWTTRRRRVRVCGTPVISWPSTPTRSLATSRRRGHQIPVHAYHRPSRLRLPELRLGFLHIKRFRLRWLGGQHFRLTLAWCRRQIR